MAAERFIISYFAIQALFAFSHPNHAEGVHIIRNSLRHIINSVGIVYHQAAGKYTLTRDEIQGRQAALDDIRRTSRVDDIPSLRLG